MSWEVQGTRFTDPTYYSDAASNTEAQLRAEFAKYHQLRETAPWAETSAHVVEYTARAHSIARRWQHDSSPEHRELWQQLTAAVEDWTSNPESARTDYSRLQQALIEGNPGVDPNIIRTQRQAAEVTGYLEPVHDQSAQDGARWRPRHLTVVPDLGADSSRKSESAADRALGGRAPEELTLAEVEAIIEATDDLLTAEETAGNLDNGIDELNALIPPQQRNAAVTFDYTAAFDQHRVQIAAVRRVQDLTAEHLRLAGEFDGTVEGGQVLIERVETLMDAARRARHEAVSAGVGEQEITAAYRAGLAGHYWSQQPGVPHLGQLDQILGERDQALTEIGVLRTELGAEANRAPELALAVGGEPAYVTTLEFPSAPAGSVISSAVDAALPDTGFAAEWSTPELTGVIDAPRREPAIDPQL